MKKAVFETKISRLMKQNQDDTKRRRTKSGLIDGSRLARYKTSSRIFKKRNEKKLGKNYFISILMDASGSMHGSKEKLCLESVIRLCDSLDKIEGMHFEVVGFNALEIKYKDYNQKYDRKEITELYNSHLWNISGTIIINKKQDLSIFEEKLANEMLAQGGVIKRGFLGFTYGENFDPMALFNSFQRTKERVGRKILLIFSDGAPTTSYFIIEEIKNQRIKTLIGSRKLLQHYSDNIDKPDKHKYIMKSVIKDKPKNLDILAVGIQSNAVKRYYKNCIIVNEINELYSETIKALSRLFKKD